MLDDAYESALVARLAAELLGKVRDAIETLPKDEAELVRRHYLEGERFDRVAIGDSLTASYRDSHTRSNDTSCSVSTGLVM